jgi:chemotaxis protein methyltransferase CheR
MSSPDLGYSLFCRKFSALTGIDLSSYRVNQMQRRVLAYLARVGVADYMAFHKILEREPDKLKDFLDYMTINVSEFFRNPDRFEDLREDVLPRLLTRRGKLRVWSAGCAGGAEPYSVAIILDEIAPAAGAEIVATDIDATILERARRGWFPANEVRNVGPARLSRYFTVEGGGFVVTPEIRRRVTFERHDLLDDAYPSGCDLIMCRNVVIYFVDESKERVYQRFWQALRPGGFLFVGGTETIFRAVEKGFTLVSPFFYQKLESRTIKIA